MAVMCSYKRSLGLLFAWLLSDAPICVTYSDYGADLSGMLSTSVILRLHVSMIEMEIRNTD